MMIDTILNKNKSEKRKEDDINKPAFNVCNVIINKIHLSTRFFLQALEKLAKFDYIDW